MSYGRVLTPYLSVFFEKPDLRPAEPGIIMVLWGVGVQLASNEAKASEEEAAAERG